MKTAEAASYLIQQMGHFSGAGRNWIGGNRRFVVVGLVAAASFLFIVSIYRKLWQSSALPFDRWDVTLGYAKRPRIDVGRDEVLTKYSPTHLASCLYTHLFSAKKTDPAPENPNNPGDWLNWLGVKGNDRAALLPLISKIFPAYQEQPAHLPEEASILTIQTWTTTVQQWVAFLGWSTITMTEGVFQSIRSSPRHAYSILFYFTAPFVAQKIWESIREPLPGPLVVLKDFYLQHRISVAVGALAFVGLLFYQMKQEKGILKNLTQIYASFQRPHKGYDQISSYQGGIQEALSTIGRTAVGDLGSNIIWAYQKRSHKTFGEEIGEALAEVTASGKTAYPDQTPPEAHRLNNLQVFELNLEEFLAERKNDIYQGWNEIMQHVAEAGNVVVVLKGLDVIASRMFSLPSNSQHGQGGGQGESAKHPETPAERLASLVALSLKNKKFRCLMVLDEQENSRLKDEFVDLFTTIKAPEVTTEDQAAMAIRLYGAWELGQPLPPEDIKNLFKRMKRVLDEVPFAPSAMMLAVEDAQFTWERSWRYNLEQKEWLKNLEAAENRLQEAHCIKEQLLKKLWEQRKAGLEEALPVMQAAVIVEKILIPLYAKGIIALKTGLPSAEQILVDAVQERFKKFFGPCTESEEQRLLALPGLLKQQIRGQDPAIEAIGEAIYSWRKVPPRDAKPLVLFLAGPSAAGKTETATVLAHHLNHVYGIEKAADQTQEKNLLRICMNREKLGGIWGWDLVKTLILEFIQKNPTGIVAFEEWDKMPSQEKSCLLELLDGTKAHMEGIYTRENDRPFVERRCVTFLIIANIAGDLLKEPAVENPKETFIEDTETVRQEIIASYDDEQVSNATAFLSRIDAVIPFRGISDDAGNSLIDTYLAEYMDDGVLEQRQLEEIRAKISSHSDGRNLQRLVREAVFQGVRKQKIFSNSLSTRHDC
jgi:hypothetical protein